MVHTIIKESLDNDKKFELMQEDARFDISSSMETFLTEGVTSIKHQVKSRNALPKVPKIFLSNECLFNCAYCGCRSSNDCKRVYLTAPRELADFSIKVAAMRKTGIFISSAIFKTPDYTVELITETLRILRQDYGYKGYIHAKVMPGTDYELIKAAGQYADRLSVNIEVAKSEGYAAIAVNKNKKNILTPMGHISNLIKLHRSENSPYKPAFATTQTTQLMVGSTGEDDYTILNLAGAMYRKYGLSRVYYTAFDFKGPARGYHISPVKTPRWRVNRLYQADRLIKNYGFTADELAPAHDKFLTADMDPKTAWALRNLHLFPIEINQADYGALLRVPGIGDISAKRIIEARKHCIVSHDVLKKLGVSLKKSKYFITCNGKFLGQFYDNSQVLKRILGCTPLEALPEQLSLDTSYIVPYNRPLHRMTG